MPAAARSLSRLTSSSRFSCGRAKRWPTHSTVSAGTMARVSGIIPCAVRAAGRRVGSPLVLAVAASPSLIAAWSCPLDCQGCGLDEDVLDDWLWAMDIELGGQAEPAGYRRVVCRLLYMPRTCHEPGWAVRMPVCRRVAFGQCLALPARRSPLLSERFFRCVARWLR